MEPDTGLSVPRHRAAGKLWVGPPSVLPSAICQFLAKLSWPDVSRRVRSSSRPPWPSSQSRPRPGPDAPCVTRRCTSCSKPPSGSGRAWTADALRQHRHVVADLHQHRPVGSRCGAPSPACSDTRASAIPRGRLRATGRHRRQLTRVGHAPDPLSSDIRNPSRCDTENPATSAIVTPRRMPVRVSFQASSSTLNHSLPVTWVRLPGCAASVAPVAAGQLRAGKSIEVQIDDGCQRLGRGGVL